MENNFNIRICKVLSNTDSADGGRIRCRVDGVDKGVSVSDLPYAFPLMPKLFHVVPRVGDSVLLLCTDSKNWNSQRFYIGPVISQPQYKSDTFGTALTLFPNSPIGPSQAPSLNAATKGAYPLKDDVAITSKGNTDLILRDNTAYLRAGAHMGMPGSSSDAIFNTTDPSYLQLTFEPSSVLNTYRSTANVVADRINLIGNNAKDKYVTTDTNDMLTADEIDNFINTAHQAVFGDTLLKILSLMIKAIAVHTHPYSGLPPCNDENIININKFDLKTILSDVVRLN